VDHFCEWVHSSSAVARLLRTSLGVLLTTVLIAGCGNAAQPAGRYPTYQFNCCSASDVNPMWQAGQTVDLHWSVEPGPSTADDIAHTIILTAVLSGPYADAPTLKKAGGATHFIQGPVIKTTNRDATPPVTTFILPADLPAGFYNLAIKMDFGGGNSMGAGSVIQVGA
jgi:hypothetical protein